MGDDDIIRTAELLKGLEPGFLPFPIFEQVARLVALPIVEFIPLRRHNDQTEVLLIARPDDDVLFPGLLHTPGTVVRATDIFREGGTDWVPFERILHEELFDTEVGPPHFFGSQLHASKRGAEQAQLYWVEVLAAPKIGEFYAVDQLPTGLIESQLIFINEAVKHFDRHHPA